MGEIVQNAVIEFRIICETLFVTFLILKLTNVITWSWWWIFSPIWIICGIILICLFLLLIIGFYGKRREKEVVRESD
jgi:hypothetical protein